MRGPSDITSKGEGSHNKRFEARLDITVDTLGCADDMALCKATFTNLRQACHAYEKAFMNAGMELQLQED